jgi:hypothetical protein
MINRSTLTRIVCLLAAWFCLALPLQAQSTNAYTLLSYWLLNSTATPTPATTPYTSSVVAQAQVDECFYGLAAYNTTFADLNNNSFFGAYYGPSPKDLSSGALTNCINAASSGAKPKINQAYVWGLTANGSDVWFATVANTLCVVLDEFSYAFSQSWPGPTQNSDYVCDAVTANPLEDFKPPRMFVYNSNSQILTDLTGSVKANGVFPDPNLLDLNPLAPKLVFGLRSAGNHDGVVYFGGLKLDSSDATKTNVVMFAFDASTKAYLGSHVFDGTDGNVAYTDIRQWHVYNGRLYTGVSTANGGQILHWTGTVANPFSFEVVGNIGADPAYFTLHSDNRIYVSTWPPNSNLLSPTTMSVWMSPPLHGKPALLTSSDANSWHQVWDLSQYEVEPAAVQVGGAIASYGGYLYFGTMHVPSSGVAAFEYLYGPPTDEDAAALGSYRPISIFRSKGFAGTKPSVQLLYGNALLPKFNPNTNLWTLVPNNLGQSGLYGRAGFGNLFNNYTWAAEVYNNQLFIGTMDWSYIAGDVVGAMPSFVQPFVQTRVQNGADLWYFTKTSQPAKLIDAAGLGNITSYGIRNLVTGPDGLWVGMANPMNLRSDLNNNPGGWKLIQIK